MNRFTALKQFEIISSGFPSKENSDSMCQISSQLILFRKSTKCIYTNDPHRSFPLGLLLVSFNKRSFEYDENMPLLSRK